MRTPQQHLVRQLTADNHVNGIESCRVGSVTLQNLYRQFALQRRKSEDTRAIMPKNELHRAITKSADAIVEKDGVAHSVNVAGCSRINERKADGNALWPDGHYAPVTPFHVLLGSLAAKC